VGFPLSPKAIAGAVLNVLTGNPSPKAAQAMLDYIVRPSASPDALAALAPQPMGRATNAAIRGTMTALPASLSGLFQPQTYARQRSNLRKRCKRHSPVQCMIVPFGETSSDFTQ
jgi:hypothetical protein